MKVAIIGASGAVGREMIKELEDSAVQDIELELYASPRSAGVGIDFRGKNHFVKVYKPEQASQNKFILMSAGGSFSKSHGKELAQSGAVVIDNSSAWRMDQDIPLVVPEVNSHKLSNIQSGIIANPNCSTIQMVVPLQLLNEQYGLEMVNVSTYQSVSGSGQQGISELSQQIQAQYKFAEPQVNLYPQQIAFNVLPAIGNIDDTGHCEEEIKMVKETQKILECSDLQVFATTARVPVLNCHCESILVKCKEKISLAGVKEKFNQTKGFHYVDDANQGDFPSPANVAGKSGIYVTRLRLPLGESESHWLQFWNVADNLKKGAATNAVQIFQHLVQN